MCPHCSAVQLVHKLLAAKVSHNPLLVSSRSTDGLWGHSKGPHVASTHLATAAHSPGVFSTLHSIPYNPPIPFHLLPHQRLLIYFLPTKASQVFSAMTCLSTTDSHTLFPGRELAMPCSSKHTCVGTMPALTGP